MDSKTFSEDLKNQHIRSIEKQVKYLEDAERQLKVKMPADEEKAMTDAAMNIQKPVGFLKSVFKFFTESKEEEKKRLKREAYEIRAQKRRRSLLQRKQVQLEHSNYNHDEIRVVLNGKSGKGKSMLGNNLLKYKAFESKSSCKGITTKCEFAIRNLGDGFDLLVIDTPGLFDSHKPNKDVSKEITRCISLAAPGPNIFIFVVSITRFTPEEMDTLINLQNIFGEKVVDYVIIVFTRKDDLPSEGIMEFMKDADGILLDLLVKCNFRFAFVNNKAGPDELRVDIDVILDLIFKTIGENNGAYYTNEMLRLADQVIGEKIKEKEEEKKRMLQQLEEEKKKLLDENPEYKSSNQVQIPSSGAGINSEDDGEKLDVPASVISEINGMEKATDKISTILKQKHADDEVSDIGNIKMKIQNLSQLYREPSNVERKYENTISELKEIKQKLDELLTLMSENLNKNPSMSHVDEDSKSQLKTIMEKLVKLEDRELCKLGKEKHSDRNPEYKTLNRSEIPFAGADWNAGDDDDDDDDEFDFPAPVQSEMDEIKTKIGEITTILKQLHAEDKVKDIRNINVKIKNLSKLFHEKSKTSYGSSTTISELQDLKQKLEEFLTLMIEKTACQSNSQTEKDSQSEMKKIMDKLNKMEDRMNKTEGKGSLTSETGWGSVPAFKQDISNTNVLKSNVDNSKIEERLKNIEEKIDSTKNTNTYIEVKKEVERDDTTVTSIGKMAKTALGIGAGVAAGAAAVAGAPLVAAAAGVAAVGTWLSSWWS